MQKRPAFVAVPEQQQTAKTATPQSRYSSVTPRTYSPSCKRMSDTSSNPVSPISLTGPSVPPSSTKKTTPTSPKVKTKQAWHKAFRNSRPLSASAEGATVTKHDTIAEDANTEASTPTSAPPVNRRMSFQQVVEKKKSDVALATELENTLEKLNKLEEEYHVYKRRMDGVEARANKNSHENRRLQLDIRVRDDDIKKLKRDLEKRNEQVSTLKRELKQTTDKVRGITNMEWKAMEYEKVNIMNENLKQKLESHLTQNRDLERKLRDRDKQIEEKNKTIKDNNEQIEHLTEKMMDLRLQVREEAVKNSKLDERLEGLGNVQQQLVSQDKQMHELTLKLEETEALLEHAKKSWKEERLKIKMYEDGEKEQNQLTEEVHFTRSENMTLKTLVIAKDSILIHKSQALENLKNLLNKQDGDNIKIDLVREVLERKPTVKPTFPQGNKVKQQYLVNGDSEINGWVEDTSDHNSKHTNPKKMGSFFHSILGCDDKRIAPGRIATGRRPQTAVVKPQNYFLSSSFSNFRSESSDTFYSTKSSPLPDSNTNKGDVNNSAFSKKPNSSKTIRPSNETNGQSKHSNNISSQYSSSNSTNNPHKTVYKSSGDNSSTESQSSGLRRSKSVDNRISPQDTTACKSEMDVRLSSPSGFSHKTMSVSTVVGSTGTGSVSAVLLKAAPQKDRLYARIVRIGDRVVIDMLKTKEKRRSNYQTGVIKFIGNLDKEYDCYRIYIGVKLDEPNGDTDGLYKGKRYFKASSNYGKFLRISKIVSIYNKETCKYEDAEDRLKE